MLSITMAGLVPFYLSICLGIASIARTYLHAGMQFLLLKFSAVHVCVFR